MLEKLHFSSIVERSFDILGRNLAGITLISVLLVGLPGMLLRAYMPEPGAEPQSLLGFSISLLVLTIGQSMLVGTVLYAVFRHLLRMPPAGIGELFSHGFHMIVPALGVIITAGVLIGIGFMLFIVPGVILSLVLFVAVPAAIAEHLTVGDALRRSGQLTNGHRWSLLGYLVVLWIASVLISWFVGLISSFFNLEEVAAVLISSLISAFSAIVAGVVYNDLRQIKEHVSPDTVVGSLA